MDEACDTIAAAMKRVTDDVVDWEVAVAAPAGWEGRIVGVIDMAKIAKVAVGEGLEVRLEENMELATLEGEGEAGD